MSSLPSAPEAASAATPTICGKQVELYAGSPASCAHPFHHFEFHWNHAGMKVTTNTNGTTGWGSLLRSTDPAVQPGMLHRFHLCASNPCQANYIASKYGYMAPPIHLQQLTMEEDLSAVAALFAAQEPLPAAVEAAVAEPSDEAPSVPADVALEVPDEPDDILDYGLFLEDAMTHLAPDVHTEMCKVPDPPQESALQTMKPPAPALPIDVDSQHAATATAVAGLSFASPAVAAQHKIRSTLLALARQIRHPRAYVGYSAFLLMGLLKQCQPCVWEGSQVINLLKVFAPWATEFSSKRINVSAIACAVVGLPSGAVALAPISEEYPLSKTCHFVGGIGMPPAALPDDGCSFQVLYASLGVATIISVVDGDCALDVMTVMLGIPRSFEARKDLRIEISDYLIARINDSWVHNMMVACQELCQEDLNDFRAGGDILTIDAPTTPAPAVADTAVAAAERCTPDEETFAAMRWVSKLTNDRVVLDLIRSLPKSVLDEQVSLYKRRDATAAASKAKAKTTASGKIRFSLQSSLLVRMQVARRFQLFCNDVGHDSNVRLPKGAMAAFTKEHIIWTSAFVISDKASQTYRMNNPQQKRLSKLIRTCYKSWLGGATCRGLAAIPTHSSLAVAAVAEQPHITIRKEKSMLKSRAPKQEFARRNALGQGAPFKAHPIRQALYEWWTGVRHAIDWTQLMAENRSQGKKNLARFPRSLLRLKLQQFVQEYTHACLLNGSRVISFNCDSWWFNRWEEDYGLCMRKANRKYAVPRAVQKERMEIMWVVCFRLRLFMLLALGYDPEIINPDQSPFHHNETGSQNKPTLAVKGSTVPVVEGNSDTKSRWTAFLTTQSRFNGKNCVSMPAAECMFKAEKAGTVEPRLQRFRVSHNYPAWFTVTVGPKGSYREHDIIIWLDRHLELLTPGREWRLIFLDDYVCHKTQNVWNLCWSRGYVRVVHGGGTTPIAQTPDTDLNEHTRREYGEKESAVLLQKMMSGDVVPKLTPEECMELMLEVLSNPALHEAAAQGYKSVGQSIDLHGAEDDKICREAAEFWNEETTDKYPNMRAKINVELADLKEEWNAKRMKWCQRDVQRLIQPFPAHRKVDRILANLGEDFYHDAIHDKHEGGDEDTDSDESMDMDIDAQGGGDTAEEQSVAAVAGESVEGVESAEPEDSAAISTAQVDAVHKSRATIAALEIHTQGLRNMGQVRSAQVLEQDMKKERRKLRATMSQSPAVADCFMRLRNAEDQERIANNKMAAQHKERKRSAAAALADRDNAVAELRKTKRKILELECVRACRHAMKTFSLADLGQDQDNAGGKQGKKNRFDVLDRLAAIKAGLSPAQATDWIWFKREWDKKMVAQHKADWGKTFAGWMQAVLEDERTNAFSKFMLDETCRVLLCELTLQVPGAPSS
jgi:hypothetical protein